MSARFVRRAALAALPLLAAACATVHPNPAPIASSRLGIAKATGTVAPGQVQLEAGYSRGQQDGRTRQNFGETLVRIGVGPRTEGRVSLSSYQRTVTSAATVEGMGDASVSIKHRLLDATHGHPAVAILVGATVPTGAKKLSAGEPQPEGALMTEWRLPAGFRALGMASWRDAVAAGDRYGLTTLAAGARRNLCDHVTGQLEYAQVHSTRAGAADIRHLRAGAMLRLTPTLQLDAWAGQASTNGVHERLFGLGFAQRW
jgi:hypothetical protein